MHWVAAAYPDQPDAGQQMDARRFFLGLSRVLPCPECQKHFAEILETNPIDAALKSGASLRKWTTEVHNAVNARLGVPPISVEQITAKFSVANGGVSESSSQRQDYVVVDNPALYQHRMLQRGIAFTGRVLQHPSKAMLRGMVSVPAIVVRRGGGSVAKNTVKRNVAGNQAPKKPRKRGCGCGAR
jgi:hypothetical protein